ncbi:hypothetical protein DPEC_G00344960 [Dallia pectoralis]|uniref:Uncharacterized protein n=1 Tax=Dallia pectoralis TaxID=75939 RepID=A0ACC2F3E2_DALPE|nr:hypothetical protein DPEC_G00344960 [Dallia pectoralis]
MLGSIWHQKRRLCRDLSKTHCRRRVHSPQHLQNTSEGSQRHEGDDCRLTWLHRLTLEFSPRLFSVNSGLPSLYLNGTAWGPGCCVKWPFSQPTYLSQEGGHSLPAENPGPRAEHKEGLGEVSLLLCERRHQKHARRHVSDTGGTMHRGSGSRPYSIWPVHTTHI